MWGGADEAEAEEVPGGGVLEGGPLVCREALPVLGEQLLRQHQRRHVQLRRRLEQQPEVLDGEEAPEHQREREHGEERVEGVELHQRKARGAEPCFPPTCPVSPAPASAACSAA
eukprot:2832170-Rhodomonas_salina.1